MRWRSRTSSVGELRSVVPDHRRADRPIGEALVELLLTGPLGDGDAVDAVAVDRLRHRHLRVVPHAQVVAQGPRAMLALPVAVVVVGAQAGAGSGEVEPGHAGGRRAQVPGPAVAQQGP